MKLNTRLHLNIMQAFALSIALSILPVHAAVEPSVEELIEEQAMARAALRAVTLPDVAASSFCEIIEGSKSPDGRWAFAHGNLPEDVEDAKKLQETAIEGVTFLIDVNKDRVLATSSVSHSGPEQTYNHNTHTVLWAADSSLALQMEEGKWETLQCEAFRIKDGKAIWLTDVKADVDQAVLAAVPALEGVSTLKLTIADDGTVSGGSTYTVPKSEEDDKEYTFHGKFASDGSFAIAVMGPGATGSGKPFDKAPELKWEIAASEQEGQPQTAVKLVADGKSVAFAASSKLETIDNKAWPENGIPADALIAVGGWWAGGGEYYYVTYEKGLLVGHRAIVEEGSDENREYFPFRYFAPGDFK